MWSKIRRVLNRLAWKVYGERRNRKRIKELWTQIRLSGLKAHGDCWPW